MERLWEDKRLEVDKYKGEYTYVYAQYLYRYRVRKDFEKLSIRKSIGIREFLFTDPYSRIKFQCC